MGGRVKSQPRKPSGECLKIRRGPQVNKQSKKIALEGLTPSRSSFFSAIALCGAIISDYRQTGSKLPLKT
jgi:hypothetical protein